MVNELPAIERSYLPGFEKIQKQPAAYPHLEDEDGGAAPAPSENGAAAQPEPSESGAEGGGIGGWFSSWIDLLSADRTVRNILILTILIILFVVYRLRGGRGRRGYL